LCPTFEASISRNTFSFATIPFLAAICLATIKLLSGLLGLPHIRILRPARQGALLCKDIETRVIVGDWSELVWGNHDAIDRRLCVLGDVRELTGRFARWKEGVDMD